MTAADELKEKVSRFNDIAEKLSDSLLDSVKMIDDMLAIIKELEINSPPPVLYSLSLGEDNLEATYRIIGQASEALRRWAKKL